MLALPGSWRPHLGEILDPPLHIGYLCMWTTIVKSNQNFLISKKTEFTEPPTGCMM